MRALLPCSRTPALRRGNASSLARLTLGAGALALALTACQTARIPADTQHLATGVHHHKVELIEGPWVIHVVEVDLRAAWQAGVRVETARAGVPDVGLEKTSVMATDAIAAINGDFFYWDKPARTSGLQIRQGTLMSQPRQRSAFAITAEGRPLVHVFGFQAGLITAAGHTLPIVHFNRRPSSDGLTYYNYLAQVSQDTVRAAMGFQLQSLGPQSVINDTVAARVMQVRRQVWPLKLSPGQWVVAAGDEHVEAEEIAPGDTVRLFCQLPPSVGHLQEAIGGGPRIVRDGMVSIEHEQEGMSEAFAADRHPRTAVGYSRRGEVLYLVTVDGRQPGYSVGMSLPELADLMATKLAHFTDGGHNAHQAVNLDGGGSTTMVVRRQVVNRPSDQTGERPVANALMVTGPAAPTASLLR